jgi:hypothetical protein
MSRLGNTRNTPRIVWRPVSDCARKVIENREFQLGERHGYFPSPCPSPSWPSSAPGLFWQLRSHYESVLADKIVSAARTMAQNKEAFAQLAVANIRLTVVHSSDADGKIVPDGFAVLVQNADGAEMRDCAGHKAGCFFVTSRMLLCHEPDAGGRNPEIGDSRRKASGRGARWKHHQSTGQVKWDANVCPCSLY